MRKKRRGRVLQYCRLFRRDPHAPDAIGTTLESAFRSPRTTTITKSHLVIDKCDLGSELGFREQWSNHFTPLFVHPARSRVRYVQRLTSIPHHRVLYPAEPPFLSIVLESSHPLHKTLKPPRYQGSNQVEDLTTRPEHIPALE